jgi:hypothetical protein
MKLVGLNDLSQPFPVEVDSSLHGFKFDAVQLNKTDIDKLLTLSGSELKEYLTGLSSKFRKIN